MSRFILLGARSKRPSSLLTSLELWIAINQLIAICLPFSFPRFHQLLVYWSWQLTVFYSPVTIKFEIKTQKQTNKNIELQAEAKTYTHSTMLGPCSLLSQESYNKITKLLSRPRLFAANVFRHVSNTEWSKFANFFPPFCPHYLPFR